MSEEWSDPKEREYHDEITFTSNDIPLKSDDDEKPRPVLMRPLSNEEDPTLPETALNYNPNRFLDDPAIINRKNIDDVLPAGFIERNRDRLLRPWD